MWQLGMWLVVGCAFVVSALIGMTLAETRGQSRVLGVVLGLLLGPLGWLICVLLPIDAQGRTRQALARGEQRVCVRCRNVIAGDVLICPVCGQPYQRVITP